MPIEFPQQLLLVNVITVLVRGDMRRGGLNVRFFLLFGHSKSEESV